jgi:cyclase
MLVRIAWVSLLLSACAATQTAPAELEVVRLRPNLYMIAGAGGNIALETGPDGTVLVDGGAAEASERVLATIHRLTDQPVRYIISTCADADHVGGNGKLSKAGRSIFATGTEPLGGEFAKAMTNGYAASVLAAENVLLRMSAPTGKAPQFPNESWPSETFSERRRYLYLNHEGIGVFREPAAHSDGDSIVFFRASDVIAAGDVIDATPFPVIDVAKGGGIQGEIDALDRVIELAVRPIPFVAQEGGTYIIPGHGRVYDQSDAVEYRDMIVTIRDIVQSMVQRGMSLEQIQAASPARPWVRQYGSGTGAWTTNDFIQAVYKSLTGKK